MSFTLLANLPGRWALAVREHQFGRGFASTLFVGALVDLAWLVPFFALALVAASALARKVGSSGGARLVGCAAIALVTASMWIVSVGATEFRLQRGTYPSLAEALEGLSDPTFFRGSIRILLFERYSAATIAALSLVAILLVMYERTRSSAFSWAPLAAAASMAAMAGALLFVFRISSAGPRDEPIAPPLMRMFADAFVSTPTRHESSVRGVLEHTRFDDAEVRSGLRLYGFDPDAAQRLFDPPSGRCRHHPLARPLPHDPADERTELGRALVELSALLFDGRDERLVVWHVALESFRADDVHALHDAAPPEITPFLNAKYASDAADSGTVAFAHAYQAGIRTAQAVSALTCAFGALPFQLALSRDLSDLGLRCAPDVLRDAGFVNRVFYGSDASFENLRKFAETHHLEVVDQSALPPDLPRGAWRAATDAALFAAATRDSRTDMPLQYNFVLTLSGHTPFDLPEDMPPGTLARIDALLRRTADAKAEDRRRLATMAYSDEALRRLIEEVESSADASHSIFLVSADHATADPFLWDRPTDRAAAAVPMFVHVPRALVAASGRESEAREKLRELDRLARRTPVSLNDVPSILMALVSRHPAMDRVPTSRRWHTLGGSSTSPWTSIPLSQPAVVWGIDASSRVFGVGKLEPHPVLTTSERSVPFSVWNDPLGPILRDGTAALSAILAGTRTCSAP